MTAYRVGIIGTGRPWKSEGATGFGMAHAHAQAYQANEGCTIVAVADIVEEHARAFAEQYGVPEIYTDYQKMLAEAQLDIVSICTWPALHADMVKNAARAGVKAIHCEKPMATTWSDAQSMASVCAELGVQLTFNHQRRFNKPFRVARELLQSGAIGKLERMEGNCGNLYDWGTHWFDMFSFFNNETRAKWVMGQIDRRTDQSIFGVKLEDSGLSYIAYENGVYALMVTGDPLESGLGGRAIRLLGDAGTIEIWWEAPHVRVRSNGETEWRIIDENESIHDFAAIARGVGDIVESLRTGRESELSARRALIATEIIFATYESSRRRARVDLPLTISDSPLQALIESGELGPKS